MFDSPDPATMQAIERLIRQHAWLIDHGRADEVTALYAKDARMYGIGPDKAGHAEIAQWANQRAAMTGRRSRHVQSNVLLRAMPDGRVGGTIILTLYRHDGDGAAPALPVMVAEYEDIYERGGDGNWRFAERRLAVLFGG